MCVCIVCPSIDVYFIIVAVTGFVYRDFLLLFFFGIFLFYTRILFLSFFFFHFQHIPYSLKILCSFCFELFFYLFLLKHTSGINIYECMFSYSHNNIVCFFCPVCVSVCTYIYIYACGFFVSALIFNVFYFASYSLCHGCVCVCVFGCVIR